MPVEIVIAYANSDREAAVQLERHLTPLVRTGKISVWYRDKIIAGEDATSELQRRMESAAIIVLLASSDLEIERDVDIEIALRQRERRGTRVIPVLLRPLALDEVRYSALRMLPDGPAISLRSDRDAAWVEVVSGLRKVVAAFPDAATATAVATEQTMHPAASPTSLSSSPPTASAAANPLTSTDPIKILFLAANPTDKTRLALDQEVREIDRRIQMGMQRNRFQLEQAWAVTVSDLSQTLLRHRPAIVHFSGHGSAQGELILLDGSGQSATVPAEALGSLFRILAARGIRCVVLNACYSEPQARIIAQYIDCVVGISGTIADQAANAFTAGFYTGLAEGERMQMAFDLGCVQISMSRLADAQRPILITRPGVDSTSLRLI